HGLNRFDPNTQQFERFEHQPNNPTSLSHNQVKSLLEDSRGTLWIGTDGGGLNRYQGKRGFAHFNHQSSDPHSLSSNKVWVIHEDHQNTLWLGTHGGGLSKVDNLKKHFGHFKHQPAVPGSLGDSDVSAFFMDAQGIFWVGTDEGLAWLDDNDGVSPGFASFKHRPSDPRSLSNNNIRAIHQDDNGTLWIGTDGGGLNRFHPDTSDFSHFKHHPSQAQSLSNNRVNAIFEDSKGTLWVGTFGGLNRYRPNTGDFQSFNSLESDPHSLSNSVVTSMVEDTDGNLWVGTYAGLNRFDGQSSGFVSYLNQPSQPFGLSDHVVLSMLVDSQGTLWVGTEGGLNRFDKQNNRFTHYREKHGLANDVVYGIVEDNRGHLWRSTNKGLSRCDPQSKSFTNFDVNDGLQSNEFNQGAFYKSGDGELFFGGINGFNRFYADNIKADLTPPPVVLTDFLIFNQSVVIRPTATANTSEKSSRFYLPKAIDALTHLTLTHHQNLVSFEFAALHFSNPAKNQYRYQLIGQDKNSIATNANKRWATYTNLAAGDYILHITASNNHGVWNEHGKSLKITVKPPPWLSWWAYAFYTLLLICLVVAFIHQQRNKIRAQQAINLRLTRADKLKDEFLANTSHELRTPLNGIIGLAESLIDGATGPLSEQTKANLAMVVGSGKRLSNLVNDLLDFSKLKNNPLNLNTGPVDLYTMVDVVLTLSRPLLGQKELGQKELGQKELGQKALILVNKVPDNIAAALADENRLQQLLHNLVGNAIKFTDAGEICVTALLTSKEPTGKTPAKRQLTISVSDTGIGIDKAHFATLYDSFKQVASHAERCYSGTGLGLAV
ncbi:MAG: ATP-binding protein, partial [Psychrosphaera sp.]|nr:ATP-binding protein [Psychrosphaera sp.]